MGTRHEGAAEFISRGWTAQNIAFFIRLIIDRAQLGKSVFTAWKNYVAQKRRGNEVDETPNSYHFPGCNSVQEDDLSYIINL